MSISVSIPRNVSTRRQYESNTFSQKKLYCIVDSIPVIINPEWNNAKVRHLAKASLFDVNNYDCKRQLDWLFKLSSKFRLQLFFKECVFNKTSDETGLRVFWNGVLRIYNCHGCCKRWYFTFGNRECYFPAAIDGVVYMVQGTGGKKNLLRVRHIEGVCMKIARGIVRVGFWVGNCNGYGTADAHTGWNSVSRIYVEEVPPPQP